MNLVKILQNEITLENFDYINEIMDIILNNNIKTAKDLEYFEFEKNYEYDIEKTIEDVINEKIEYIENFIEEDFMLPREDIDRIKKELSGINEYKWAVNIVRIIRCFHIMKKPNPFPYFTYELIIQGKSDLIIV